MIFEPDNLKTQKTSESKKPGVAHHYLFLITKLSATSDYLHFFKNLPHRD